MTVKQRAWQTFCESYAKPVKILVWKNKDFDSPGQEVTLHSKYMKSWNAVLNFLTVALHPRFGAVRKLYHLGTRKIVLCLQDIQTNEKYVAVGADNFKFKKNGYLTEEEKRRPRSSKSLSSSIQVENNNNSVSIDNFMEYTKKKNRTVVYFMVSGRACQLPLKVVLIESDFLDYSMIIEYLGYRLDIGEGIQYICDTRGKTITKMNDLHHGELYVAVPYTGKFIKLDYHQLFTELMPQTAITLEKPKTRKKKKARRSASEGPIEPRMSSEVGLRQSRSGDRQSFESSLMKAKCVSTKCADKECRLFRDEFVSRPASFTVPRASDLGLVNANWNWGVQTDFKDKVDEITDDVSMVREILDKLLDETMNMVIERGFSGDHEKESVTTVEWQQKARQSGNLTTFADIAQAKEPIFGFDLPSVQAQTEPSLSSVYKKSVTFFRNVTTPGGPSFTPSTTSFTGAPTPSILKVKAPVAPQPRGPYKELPIIIKPSFLKLRDSIDKTQPLDMPAKISAILVEDLEDDDVAAIEIYDPFPDEGDEFTFSRGVQKNWRSSEEISNKWVQTGTGGFPRASSVFSRDSRIGSGKYAYGTRPSDALYYSGYDMSDIYDNFERDLMKASVTDSMRFRPSVSRRSSSKKGSR